jgi:thymidylate synthase
MDYGFYKPLAERTPDSQYQDHIAEILREHELIKETPQGVGALTRFGTLNNMVFNLSNGVPLITERKIGFWRKPVSEIIAFINGARTLDDLAIYGCDFWESYRDSAAKFGIDLEPGDLGPGSYGAAFHDYETPYGLPLNQIQQVIDQIREYPSLRTLLVTPWKPYFTARGPNRKVIVAPCHGWLHFRVINGKLHMRMDQRSADMPIGVPSNLIQYAALHLMICQVTGYPPGNYIHSLSDAHIYEDQVGNMEALLGRSPRKLPLLRLDPSITNIFDFRANHFEIEEYDPHPPMSKIPWKP